jgi:hypothetical protein
VDFAAYAEDHGRRFQALVAQMDLPELLALAATTGPS